jgi:plastocyanin
MSISLSPRFIPAAVLLVIICLIAGCTSGQSPAPSAAATAAPAGPAHAITIKNFAFSPSTLTVKAGSTVVWTNEDGAPHQIASDDGAPAPFTSSSLATGASFPFTFTQAGTYPYHCSIHPSMTGTIVVQP